MFRNVFIDIWVMWHEIKTECFKCDSHDKYCEFYSHLKYNLNVEVTFYVTSQLCLFLLKKSLSFYHFWLMFHVKILHCNMVTRNITITHLQIITFTNWLINSCWALLKKLVIYIIFFKLKTIRYLIKGLQKKFSNNFYCFVHVTMHVTAKPLKRS